MVTNENRTKMVGCHMTPSKQKFLRVYAAEQGMTISSFIEKTISDVLSKVEKEDNPFTKTKNKL